MTITDRECLSSSDWNNHTFTDNSSVHSYDTMTCRSGNDIMTCRSGNDIMTCRSGNDAPARQASGLGRPSRAPSGQASSSAGSDAPTSTREWPRRAAALSLPWSSRRQVWCPTSRQADIQAALSSLDPGGYRISFRFAAAAGCCWSALRPASHNVHNMQKREQLHHSL